MGSATLPACELASGTYRDLGVDAIWYNPWYASPLMDGGYDVADYRAIDPTFGTLAEAEALIAEALNLGIRTIIDIVPNHVSDQHPWFIEAHAGGPGSPIRDASGFAAGGAAAMSRRTTGPRTSATRRGRGRRTLTGHAATGSSICSPPGSLTSTGTTRRPRGARGNPALLVRPWRGGNRIDSAALAIKDAALPDLA